MTSQQSTALYALPRPWSLRGAALEEVCTNGACGGACPACCLRAVMGLAANHEAVHISETLEALGCTLE
jgi:hypothetical protein